MKYVYRHRTETDNRVFYIGAGSNSRCFERRKDRRSKEWFDIYEKEGLIVEILHITEDEEEALELEALLIQEYGRIVDGGSLVNKATYRSSGYSHTEETKQLFSELKKGDKHHMFGKKHPSRKPVLQYSKDGIFIKEYDNAYDAAKELNLHQPLISNVCNGKCKTTGGFVWKYKEEETE